MLIQNSAISGLAIVLNFGGARFGVVVLQLLGYGILFYSDPPKFDDPDNETKVMVIFHFLLFWHLTLGILQTRTQVKRMVQKQNVPVPFQTYLVLAQLVIMGYLLEYWILNPPDDTKNMTPPRLLWESWVIFEVMTTASTLPNCMIYLLFRAAGIDLFDYRQ